MKKHLKLVLFSMALFGMVVNAEAKKIHLIGDSTMAEQDENSTDKRGWGMMFQQFFTSAITINNRAKSGASSKSYYEESPYWTTVKKQIESGDYVLIQFSHNDEKNGGLDGDTVRATTDPTADYRGTTAQGTFKKYLRAYVTETRELGATPILATAMCRKYFSSGSITRKGHHDLGDNFGVPESDHTYDYSYAMQEIATEMNVLFIDLTSLTKDLFESYGDAACTSLIFSKDDGTHPNAFGATSVARLCAQDMVKQNILAEYINTATDVLINPSDCDFGTAYTGQTLTKEVTITGFDLQPASGTFTLSVTDGFAIAANKTDVFASSITIDYSNENLDFSRFYISVNQSTQGKKTGTLSVTNGTITKDVPLSAKFIELSGGTEVKLFWELSADESYVLEGPANPVDESWSEMYAQRYAAPNSAAVWPAESGYDATRKTQRNLLNGDVWPAGEIDEVSTRFIQFGIAASESTILNVDSIGMYVCGAGGSGMRCRISYSTNNFADYTVIQEFSSMVSNNIYSVSIIPVERLNFGDTLLVRVYPWYSSEASGKTICLADVSIHAIATSDTVGTDITDDTDGTSVENITINDISFSVVNGNLSFSGLNGDCQIDVFNLPGAKISSKSIKNQAETYLSIPEKPGIYIIRVKTPSQQKTLKFSVK